MVQFELAEPAGGAEAATLARRQCSVPAQAGAAAAVAVCFSVRYALFEYLHFMWQHGRYLIRRRRLGAVLTYLMLARSTATAALHFVLQRRARRTYDYTVDAHGIVRTTAGGVTLIPWADVSAIRRYTPGFMLVMRRGTLPIPFRCLASGQRAALDAYADALVGQARYVRRAA